MHTLIIALFKPGRADTSQIVSSTAAPASHHAASPRSPGILSAKGGQVRFVRSERAEKILTRQRVITDVGPHDDDTRRFLSSDPSIFNVKNTVGK